MDNDSIIILPTSAEIKTLKEMRDDEYLKTIHWLKNNIKKHKIIFLETVLKKGSFIEKYYPVYYSGCHNSTYRNKGSNLGNALKNFLSNNKVNEDLVIQLTGRYNFIDDTFFTSIENNPGYDFYGKLFEVEDQYFTGCFAMKTEYMIEWVNSVDWDYLNYAMINIEKSLRNYVVSKNLKTYHLDVVNIDCNIFGDGTHLDKRII